MTSKKSKEKFVLPPWQDFIAGCTAGAFSKTITSPLYVVKNVVLIQSSKPLSEIGLKNTLKTFQQVYNEKGFLAFWKGNALTVLKTIPYSGIKFLSYDQLRFNYLISDKTNHEHAYRKSFIAGCGAGLIASLISHPLWLVKMNAVSIEREGMHQSQGLILHTIKTMVARGGITSFYRGLAINVVGSVPYEGMLFMSYNGIKSWWPQNERGIGVQLTAGFVAGLVAQTVSHPFHVLKERMKGSNDKSYAIKVAAQIIKQDGLLGLYKGTLASLVKSIPYIALQFIIYEQCVTLFRNANVFEET